MMRVKQHAKRALMRTGLYYPARHLYRRLHPRIVKHRRSEIAFYRSLIRPGDLCCDVGAHLGAKVEALLEVGARVVAIEPEPIAIASLTAQFANHPRFDLVKRGISAEPGRAILHRRPDTLSMTSLRSDWGYGQSEPVEIELTTLDRVIETYGIPRYLKVDVEGFETEVFRGLTRPVSLISFEFHVAEIERARQCIALLERLGPFKVNVTHGDSTQFLFDAWLPAAELFGRVEDGWKQGERGDLYLLSDSPGDIPEGHVSGRR